MACCNVIPGIRRQESTQSGRIVSREHVVEARYEVTLVARELPSRVSGVERGPHLEAIGPEVEPLLDRGVAAGEDPRRAHVIPMAIEYGVSRRALGAARR